MILRAPHVAPVAGPLIDDGFVEISGDRIARIGRAVDLPLGWTPDLLLGDVELPSCILTPGLVNPHTHLELTGYAGALSPSPLWHWFDGLMALRRMPGAAEIERAAVVDGAWRSLRAGVTCVGDISRTNLSWQALDAIPIRKVCFAELLSLASAPPRTIPELVQAVDQMTFASGLGRKGVSPHAPYTVHWTDIEQAVQLASFGGIPWTMHLAETPEEVSFLNGDASAMPPVIRAFQSAGNLRPPPREPQQSGISAMLTRIAGLKAPGLLAHVNYIRDEEIGRLKETGCAIAYCPRAHRFFGHRDHPLPRLLAAGVPVVFGTDSLASNESLSILDELRLVRRKFPGLLTAEQLLRMATLDAAGALNWSDEIGSLEPGKQADLAAFPISPRTSDSIAGLIESAPPASAVWVGGRRAF